MSAEILVSVITGVILVVCVFFAFGGSGLIFRSLPYFKRVRRRLVEVDTQLVTFPDLHLTVKDIRLRCGAEVTFTHWFPDLVRDLEGGITRTLGVTVIVQIGFAIYRALDTSHTTFASLAEVSAYVTTLWRDQLLLIWAIFAIAIVFLAIFISNTKTHFIKYRDVVAAY
jgi:hypothetical protein